MDEDRKEAVLSAVDQALEGSDDRRSALHQWMIDNYDHLSERFKDRRPNWKKLAQVFTEQGLSEGGVPLTEGKVRHCWWRVKQSKAGRTRRGGKASSKVGAEVSRASVPSPPAKAPVVTVAQSVGDTPAASPPGKAVVEDDGGWASLDREINKRSGGV